MKKITLGSLCLVSVLVAQSASAANFTVSGSVGGAPTGVKYVNFDNLTLGTLNGTVVANGNNGTVKVTGNPNAQVTTGSVGGINAAPYISNSNGSLFGDATVSGADQTPYLTTGTTAITLEFGSDQKYIGLLWGSVDNYNTLEFYDSGNNLLGSVTGSDVTGSPNGNQGVNGTLYVNIDSDTAFRYVKAKSSQFAFEFDNVAYNETNVPDGGSTLVLLSAALMGLGAVSCRTAKA